VNRKEHEARKRGECLAAFLEEVPTLTLRNELIEYLELRNVRRYRITELKGAFVVRVELPPHKMNVLDDIAERRPAFVFWQVAELPWWYQWRRVRVLEGRPVR